jgi:hypothetical protein
MTDHVDSGLDSNALRVKYEKEAAGTGSTAIRCTPDIAETAEHLPLRPRRSEVLRDTG